jgi:hypothetical protein
MDIPINRDMTLHLSLFPAPCALSPAPFFYSYLNALTGLLLATRVVFPATVNHAITSAINPEPKQIGIMNKG